jgi:tight adherence protein C
MALRTRILATHLPLKPSRGLLLASLKARLTTSRAESRQIDYELPDFTQALGLLMGNGLPVNVALGWLTPRSTGLVARVFLEITHDLELGADLVERLQAVQLEVQNQGLTELCEKLSVAILRGAPISHQLIAHAEATRSNLQRLLLRQAGSNETKMLIPVIFLILSVTVLFAIFPSLLLLMNQL